MNDINVKDVIWQKNKFVNGEHYIGKINDIGVLEIKKNQSSYCLHTLIGNKFLYYKDLNIAKKIGEELLKKFIVSSIS